MNPNKVITRFAPSPTGFMHVGGIRTAIYGWLFARKHGGTFILRIEDTDKEREVPGSTEHIMESLRWLGITWDEGPVFQSQRLALYQQWAAALIERGFAYPDPYTEEEVEVFRKQAAHEKRAFLFRDHRPEHAAAWDGTQPLRFRVPEMKRYEWYDIVRGELSAGEEALDDFILMKGDGYPTYNFAHIIDDHEMGVTHVMRGEEFIASTPKFLSLYDALGFERPYFATMPIILGPDGKKKLSKRDGAKDILEYRTEGFLPEAMVNFLALLGWHPEGDQEIFTTDELIQEFNIARLQKGGARFDETKLRWIDHEHLKRLPDETYATRLGSFAGRTIDQRLVPLLKERAATLKEAADALDMEFDFFARISVSKELLLNNGKIAADAAKRHLEHAHGLLQASRDAVDADAVKALLMPYADAQGRGEVLWPLRVALSGKAQSPNPFMIVWLLGSEESLRRIEAAAKLL